MCFSFQSVGELSNIISPIQRLEDDTKTTEILKKVKNANIGNKLILQYGMPMCKKS